MGRLKEIPFGLVLTLIAVPVFLLWFFSTYERYEKEKESFTTEYQQNQYFLLETFFNDLGFDADSSRSESDIYTLGNKTGTLFLLDERQIINTRSTKIIKEWVNDGGTLLMELPHDPNKFETDFLKEFSIKSVDGSQLSNSDSFSYGTSYAPGEGCYTHNALYIDCDTRDEITFGNFVNTEEPFEVDIEEDEEINLEDLLAKLPDTEEVIEEFDEKDLKFPYSILASNPTGAAYVNITYGEGEIIFASHLDGLNNNSIDDKDNAYFLTSLISNKTKEILISYNTRNTSFLKALWLNAKWPVIMFLSTLVIFLWSMIQRFGPLKNLLIESRQDLKTHLQSSADFLWEADKLHDNIASLRSSILRRLQVTLGRRLDLSDPLSREKVQDYLSTKFKDMPDNTLNLLFSDLPNNELELIKITKQLNQVRSFL